MDRSSPGCLRFVNALKKVVGITLFIGDFHRPGAAKIRQTHYKE